MLSRSRTILLVICVAALASAVLWYLSGHELQGPDARQSDRDAGGRPVGDRDVTPGAPRPDDLAVLNRQLSSNATSNGAPGSRNTTTHPLPPTTEPLSKVYRDLVRSVREGELPAACRLAVELERCSERNVTGWKQSLENQTQALTKLPKEGAETELADRRLSDLRTRVEELSRHCGGFVDTEGVPAWKYLFAAASNGHMPSMLRFAITPPLGPDTATYPDGWLAYRDNAGRFLELAARTGNRQAVFHLAFEYLGKIPKLGGSPIVPVDQQVALRYLLVSRSLDPVRPNGFSRVEKVLGDTKAGLTEEQVRTATREAEEFVRGLSAHGALATDEAKMNQRLTIDGEDCSR